MALTSRSSFSAGYATVDDDVIVQEAQNATVTAERPDETDVEDTVVSVMGDAVAVGESTFAYSSGFSAVDGNSFYASFDLIAVAVSDIDIAYTSTAALQTYSGSADAVFSIQTSRTQTVSDGDTSVSASTTSGSTIGLVWADGVSAPPSVEEPPDLDVILIDDGCGISLEGNVAFAIGDATAVGDATFTDLSLSVFTLEDTISSASFEILIIA